MHMADALLSPTVGGAMWVAAGGAIAWSSRHQGKGLEDQALPLMGVLGAFVFAAQMINIAIPGTGSSGHLGGGLLLAILLGPSAGFLTMASILVVQALLFADGGLLALGCNLFNLGVLPCFAGHRAFRWLTSGATSMRISLATLAAAVFGVQLGALAVVTETTLSGISALPFPAFFAAMASIHLPIGIVEGVATSLVVKFLRQARPEIWTAAVSRMAIGGSGDRILAAVAVATVLTAGVLSWFASDLPDGLEWSVMRIAGTADLPAPTGKIHTRLADVQAETALLPEYRFRPSGVAVKGQGSARENETETSVAGLVGGVLSFLLTVVLAWVVRWTRRRRICEG